MLLKRIPDVSTECFSHHYARRFWFQVGNRNFYPTSACKTNLLETSVTTSSECRRQTLKKETRIKIMPPSRCYYADKVSHCLSTSPHLPVTPVHLLRYGTKHVQCSGRLHVYTTFRQAFLFPWKMWLTVRLHLKLCEWQACLSKCTSEEVVGHQQFHISLVLFLQHLLVIWTYIYKVNTLAKVTPSKETAVA